MNAQNASFAEVLKDGNNSIERPPSPQHYCLPDKQRQTERSHQKLLQTLIKPKVLKLHIRGIRKTKDGGSINK